MCNMVSMHYSLFYLVRNLDMFASRASAIVKPLRWPFNVADFAYGDNGGSMAFCDFLGFRDSVSSSLLSSIHLHDGIKFCDVCTMPRVFRAKLGARRAATISRWIVTRHYNF